jgi:hypothetical protein
VKVGAENRTKLTVAIALVAVAVVVFLSRFVGSAPTAAAPASTDTPASAISQPATPPRPARRTKVRGKKISSAPRSLDPTLRYDWLKASEDTKYEGAGRNIFLAQAEIPQPVAPATPDKEANSGPPPPPPPPPINLKFFGFASKPGESKKIFLSEGEDVFIAAEGEVVNRHYKVLRISPTSVEIEDVLNNNRQSIPLTLG